MHQLISILISYSELNAGTESFENFSILCLKTILLFLAYVYIRVCMNTQPSMENLKLQKQRIKESDEREKCRQNNNYENY